MLNIRVGLGKDAIYLSPINLSLFKVGVIMDISGVFIYDEMTITNP